MSENWPAVAKAVNDRMSELDIRQKELAARSGVSLAMVREIQNNTAQRRRNVRTLEALSTGLGWHPQHLAAVLRNRRPPKPGEPREDMDDAVSARLGTIEDQLGTVLDEIAALRRQVASLGDHDDG